MCSNDLHRVNTLWYYTHTIHCNYYAYTIRAVGSNFELVRFLHELAIHYLLLTDTYQTIDQNVFSLLQLELFEKYGTRPHHLFHHYKSTCI